MKQKIINIYNKLPYWLKNKYIISGTIFFIWIFFFDTNSLLMHIDQKKEIKKIENDINYYKTEINKDEKIINIITNDSLTPQLEKYLREKLFLSKKNEEVFIVESEEHE